MVTISSDATVQTVLTTFECTPGTCEDIIDALSDAYAAFISKQPGFVGAAIHANDAETRVASYSQWERREDFQAMLRTKEMRERNRAISALARSFEPVMYDVVARF